MIPANISYKASVLVDGEIREVAGNETVDAQNIITGSQTVGTTYEMLVGTGAPEVALFLYNAGEVDVAVRVRILIAFSDKYIPFTIIPGGVLCLPKVFFDDGGTPATVEDIFARSETGTAKIEYCHLF